MHDITNELLAILVIECAVIIALLRKPRVVAAEFTPTISRAGSVSVSKTITHVAPPPPAPPAPLVYHTCPACRHTLDGSAVIRGRATDRHAEKLIECTACGERWWARV
jgi:DNA-directed RNA polymerase subunit M/transcription elongation factor TFIIS